MSPDIYPGLPTPAGYRIVNLQDWHLSGAD